MTADSWNSSVPDLMGWSNPETQDFWVYLMVGRQNHDLLKIIRAMILGGARGVIGVSMKEILWNYGPDRWPRGRECLEPSHESWLDRVNWSEICEEIEALT